MCIELGAVEPRCSNREVFLTVLGVVGSSVVLRTLILPKKGQDFRLRVRMFNGCLFARFRMVAAILRRSEGG